jgi:toxin FitB
LTSGSTKYLLDTTILSEGTEPRLSPGVQRFTEAVSLSDLYISVVSLGEIRRGIALHPDEVQRAGWLLWLTQDIYVRHAGHILPIDDQVMSTWAQMVVATGRRPGQLPALDAFIAATALSHRLTVVTRNVSDFQQFGVQIFNPFTEVLQ